MRSVSVPMSEVTLPATARTVDPRGRDLEQAAAVAVRVGANVRPGQFVVVAGPPEQMALIRAVAREGWAAGASDVQIFYSDGYERFYFAAHADEQLLDRTPIAHEAIARGVVGRQAAWISVSGDPAPPNDVDTARLARAVPRVGTELLQRLINEKALAWTIVAAADETWATRVFGEPDVARLEQLIVHAMRLDVDDPVAAWNDRIDALALRARGLNEKRFEALHFEGPGTDLVVPLLPAGSWVSARNRTAWGQEHSCNLPTEEVFATPDCRAVEGNVAATRPLAVNGTIVSGLRLEFSSGRLVSAQADDGIGAVDELLGSSPCASKLGEVALVAESAVAATDFVFQHMLFDENAASHVALGMAYEATVDGATSLTDDEAAERGINRCLRHVDIAIGGEDVMVTGLKGDDRLPIVRGSQWSLA